jgi:hypothetical protein
MKITTIGLDLAKSGFQVHDVDATVRSWFASRFDGRRCCHFLQNCLLAWSASKRAARRITGRAS